MKTIWIVSLFVLVSCGSDSANNGNNRNNTNNSNNINNLNNLNNRADGGADSGSDLGMERDMPIVNRDNWYPGVPFPTDTLPGGIMPTLPTPNAVEGWPYDPIAIPNPEPTGAANEYVVAVDGDDGAAGNGGNGTVEMPRRSIPDGNFPAGTKIFIQGANSDYGTVDFDIGEADVSFDCTDADPCFVVGIDTPRVGYRLNISGSNHLIIDGISLVDTPNANRAWGRLTLDNSRYITTRNMEIRGDGSNTSGGAAFSINATEYLMSFRMQIHEIGSWDSNATGLDVHGWRPGYRNRYLWLIDSELYHLQADGVQVGNSNNQNPQGDSSHYIFIAGNRFWECYENALDNKNGYHVIFSSNEVREFYAAPGAGGANGTAIILSNNSEGPWTGYHWAVNNKIWNTSLAIRDSGSELDEKNYAVGNTIWNANAGLIMANNAQNREFWIVHNTVYNPTVAVDVNQPGSNSSIWVRYNIFVGGELDTQNQVNSLLSSNVLFNTTVDNAWDQAENENGDPMLADPENGDMTPMVGSSALDLVFGDEVFDDFEALYGVSIRADQNGVGRASQNADIGAIEIP